MIAMSKIPYLNWLVQGGQLYCAFLFIKGSLPLAIISILHQLDTCFMGGLNLSDVLSTWL
jgi:hypothetical protein